MWNPRYTYKNAGLCSGLTVRFERGQLLLLKPVPLTPVPQAQHYGR